MATGLSQEDSGTESRKKQPDMKILMLVSGLLSLLAGAGGWFLGVNIDAIVPFSSYQSPAAAAVGNEVTAHVIVEDPGITVLPPILTNMASPETAWVRMECSLVAKPEEKISPDIAAAISSDFLAFLRDSTLSRIKGSTGLMYLHEDLLERASIRSGGKIAHILISGLVVEE